MNTALHSKQIIKKFDIETKGKHKSLQIIRGNIFEDSSDIIAVTAYEEGGKPAGEMYESFMNRFAEAVIHERDMLFNSNAEKISITELKMNQSVLLLHLKEGEGQRLDLRKLANVLKMLFTSIATYIYEGNQVKSVSLPVVFRKGIKEDDYRRYIETYIYEASDFLRKHLLVEEIKVFLWHEEDQQKWLQILDEMIPGHAEVFNLNNHITALIKNIRTAIYDIRSKGYFKRDCNTMIWALYEPEERLTQIVNTAVRIIDWLTKELCGKKGIPQDWKSIHIKPRLMAIKSSRAEAEWFITYLINIFEFQKYARNHTVKKEDIYLYMSYLLRVLQYCSSIIKESEEHHDQNS
jgi:hypothetical protein